MTTTANNLAKPEPIYEPLQFEMDDAPKDVKDATLLMCLATGELITNDFLMNAITMGFNMLPRVAPTPGDRVRITALLSDEVRHCFMNDSLARALGGDPSAVTFFSPDGKFDFSPMGAVAADALTDHLPSFEGLTALVPLFTGQMGRPTTDSSVWATFAVFNMCIDRVAGMMIKDTINASFAPLARMNRGIAVDEAGHAQAGFHHLRDVCATEAGREDAQSALDLIWPMSQVMFDLIPAEQSERILRLGLIERYPSELKQDYIDVAVPLLEGLGLRIPDAA